MQYEDFKHVFQRTFWIDLEGKLRAASKMCSEENDNKSYFEEQANQIREWAFTAELFDE